MEKKFYAVQWPHGHSGQPGQVPPQVVELGNHASEALLDLYRDKGATVVECNEDGSPLIAPDADSNKVPAGAGNAPTSREARAVALADMDYPTLCELAKTYGLAGTGLKRTVVESEILATEFPESAEGEQ